MRSPQGNVMVDEIAAARRASGRALALAFLFSVFVNLLMLTAPLYMLQVYDRVLASRSEPTLIALTALMAFLFVMMGLLDHARSRILARIGARLQERLDPRVLSAGFRRLSLAPGDPAAQSALHDLETVARIWQSPVLVAILDLPWTPLFLGALFIFHPAMGWFAVAGAVVLMVLTWANQRQTDAATAEAGRAAMAASRQAENLRSDAELIRAMGMTTNAFRRWQLTRDEAGRRAMTTGDVAGTYATTTKTLRMFLQSAILGLGAWLVLRGELSAGAMIAGSILMGRALQPIEVAIGQWPTLARARAARARLSGLLAATPVDPPRTALPRPRGQLDVQGLTVIPPGEKTPTLRGISLTLAPGQAIGVIGPSGSGKSSLARALVGLWPPVAGSVRLDGATLDQYDPDFLGACIGYLPQRVTLFDGTIAENIARLSPQPDPARIVAAAQKAAVHDLILRLPQGYDTRITATGSLLSGGQVQRIGLARAFYGDPVLLVLDEPNSNLDNDGSQALNHAIRAAKASGAAVLIMAHRPAAIQECDLLMVMKDGMVQTLGPRDQVLREAVQNAASIVPASAGTGAALRSGGMT